MSKILDDALSYITEEEERVFYWHRQKTTKARTIAANVFCSVAAIFAALVPRIAMRIRIEGRSLKVLRMTRYSRSLDFVTKFSLVDITVVPPGKIPELFPYLEKFEFPAHSGMKAHSNWSFLSKFSKTLRELNIAGQTACGWMAHIKELVNLRSLDLSNCRDATNASLRHLSKLPLLKKLNLSGCNKISDLKHLPPSLVELNINGTSWRNGLKEIEHLKNLRYITFGGNAFNQEMAELLVEHMPELDHLEFVNSYQVSDSQLEVLKDANYLDTIQISNGGQIKGNGFKDLCLRVVELTNCHQLDLDACFAALADGSKNCLQFLRFNGNHTTFTDAGCQSIGEMKNLVEVDLQFVSQNNNYGYGGYHIGFGINELPTNANISNTGLVSISRCKNLNKIQFMPLANVDDFSALAPLRDTLLTLNIRGFKKVTDESIKGMLESLPNLVAVDCSHCRELTNMAVRYISRYGASLRRLDLSRCPKIDGTSLLYLYPGKSNVSQIESLGVDTIKRPGEAELKKLKEQDEEAAKLKQQQQQAGGVVGYFGIGNGVHPYQITSQPGYVQPRDPTTNEVYSDDLAKLLYKNKHILYLLNKQPKAKQDPNNMWMFYHMYNTTQEQRNKGLSATVYLNDYNDEFPDLEEQLDELSPSVSPTRAAGGGRRFREGETDNDFDENQNQNQNQNKKENLEEKMD